MTEEQPKMTEDLLRKTFVFDGREVKLTGRTAVQKKRSGKFVTVWEIIPVSVANTAPTQTSFNKWIKPLDLYHIQGTNKLAEMHEAAKKAAQEAAAKPAENVS
jgi:hypothetical protein